MALVEEIAETQGVSKRWLKAALKRRLRGHLPLPPGFPLLVQIRELCQLLGTEAIILAQDIPSPVREEARLAEEVSIPMVRLIKEKARCPQGIFSPGLPHPQSPAEQRLARAMAKDPQLAGLFLCNQPVETALGHRYVVDFLWPSGRLAVEVDGYRYHSSRVQFALDRQRDYELQLSGYRVLRLTHDEVMGDVEAALAKVRRMVECLRGSPP